MSCGRGEKSTLRKILTRAPPSSWEGKGGGWPMAVPPAGPHPATIGNRLLAALPPADFYLLAPELETVVLDQDAILSRAGDQIEHVFFPNSGAISLMIDMANGQTVATAAVGREVAVRLLSVLGPSPSANTAIVCAAGTASRIPASRVHAAFNPSPAIRHAGQIHIRALLIQFILRAARNTRHS